MISVCMATFNGEKFLREQLDSVLLNLGENDEVIISDDGSTDKTIEVIESYVDKDSRISLLAGPRKGIIANFENAIINCHGDYIYLCDQDDVWSPDKVFGVQKAFSVNEALVVVHDAQVVDKNLKEILPSFFEFRNSGAGFWHNFYKNGYIGCCMAFKRELLPFIIPIPKNIEMHDQWIGMWGDLKGKNVFIPEKLLKYRRYENNVSGMEHHPLLKMVRNRIVLLTCYIKRNLL